MPTTENHCLSLASRSITSLPVSREVYQGSIQLRIDGSEEDISPSIMVLLSRNMCRHSVKTIARVGVVVLLMLDILALEIPQIITMHSSLGVSVEAATLAGAMIIFYLIVVILGLGSTHMAHLLLMSGSLLLKAYGKNLLAHAMMHLGAKEVTAMHLVFIYLLVKIIFTIFVLTLCY